MKFFVSYSHKDRQWLDRLNVHLAPLTRQNLDLWDDQRIAPGALWKQEIRDALANSNGAILLVTAQFLASQFIANEELPAILRQAKVEGRKVLSLIIGPCLFEQSPLSEFQTLNEPSKPLNQLRRPAQEKVLKDVAETIWKFSTATDPNAALLAHSNSSNVVEATSKSGLIGSRVFPTAHIDVALSEELRSEMIRVSISGLFRIQYGDKFLLIKGQRIGQYQPVGGVLKRWPSAARSLDVLGVRDDDKIGQDKDSLGDLRIQVPGRSLGEFFEWYRSEKNRETHPWREFHEELLATRILPINAFPHIATEHLGTYVSGLTWSVYFQCWEVLVSEIYQTYPDREQTSALSELYETGHPDVRWALESEIRSRGVIPGVRLVADIAENAMWLL